MAYVPYTLTSYTNNTWTDICTAPSDSLLVSISISNTTDSSISVSVQITNASNTELHQILPPQGITGYNNLSNAEVRQALTSGWKVRAKAAAAGVHFMATLMTAVNS